ncbi:MAG: aminotransferase class I/II-fold pyridoxal phosphate-dependent enzyme [Candidatus Aquirickettsiella gammari]|jgi:CDP-6-deoxy-D-xylo-4-hexulose-3-dehydrase|uniref:Aminotransferase class I/II-fold pyridoxal phosphate-dependent enzyme n=1 Tax=Candidatus Aquirickettsiella gammari TaxID=2016198 RepID=A0A370CJC5_9COXI|nr:MAG: aminotransferase class I/II-fold pyridoxal phosphate-dependent enzyme [Candidatus Aquirickettsiella gammari]
MNENFLHVPYGKTVHGEDEIAAVVSVLRSSTQMGKHVREMEEKIAQLFNKKFGIMLNSGSSANYLAIELLELPEASEVITPVLTFSTTVAPLVKNGLIPAFIDIEPNTFNIDVDQIENMLSPKTKALVIPNLLGNLPNWEKIREIANKYGLLVIEDSCDTLGATINGNTSGYYSDISTTSFYGSHIINCAGNGGMLCVNNLQFAERAKLLRSWGRSSSLFLESETIDHRFHTKIDGIEYDEKFIFETIGYNLEPSEMGAAFGLVQLSKLNDNIKRREEVFKAHINFFSSYEDWFILPKQLIFSKTAWLAFPLIVRDSAPFKRKDLQIFLEQRNIQTRTIFTGNILRQPGFSQIEHRASIAGYPNADQVMRGGILIACHHGVTVDMMAHIYNTFEEFSETQVRASVLS